MSTHNICIHGEIRKLSTLKHHTKSYGIMGINVGK